MININKISNYDIIKKNLITKISCIPFRNISHIVLWVAFFNWFQILLLLLLLYILAWEPLVLNTKKNNQIN